MAPVKAGDRLISESGPRKPRVHIKYNTSADNQGKDVEIPFIVGVMANLSGDNAEKLPDVSQRKFVGISSDNFETVMQKSNVGARVDIEATIPGHEGTTAVDLTFEKMEDFSPEAVARKVGFLKDLLDKLEQLNYLKTKMDGNMDAVKEIEKQLKDIKG